MPSLLSALLQAMRPHQWVKNLLVFAPLFFTKRLTDLESVLSAGQAFVVFCAAASSIYLLNDVVDREADRNHPKKKLRPIASGRLPVPAAMAAWVALTAVAIGLGWGLGAQGHRYTFAVWPIAYLVLNYGYCFFLKRIVIVDAICIALGFQLRVIAGVMALDQADVSNWLLLCTFFFALFVAFCKRREEVTRQAESTGVTRKSLKDYDQAYLDQLMPSLAACSILSYALYTLADGTVERHGTDNMVFTVPFVVYGVFRYLWLVHNRQEGGDPARLLFRDKTLMACGLLYFTSVYLILGKIV